jgi:RimJ/RimL family protein N-acetyltransferase
MRAGKLPAMSELPESLRLEGGSVVLRDWRDADAPVLEAVCGEWNVCSFTSVPCDYAEAEALAWIERTRRKQAAGEVLGLAITADGHDVPVGHFNLTAFGEDGRSAAIGYWLVPRARGRGLASAACRLLIDWGFDSLDLERVEFAILPENVASQAVAKRVGAVPEGLREMSHQEHGRWWDMNVYAVRRQAASAALIRSAAASTSAGSGYSSRSNMAACRCGPRRAGSVEASTGCTTQWMWPGTPPAWDQRQT